LRRTSILLDEETYELLACRARQHQRSLSEEIRAALAESVEDYNPNQAWLDLADEFKEFTFKPGPPVDSDEFKEEMVREIYRDSFNREPDW
jgi:plasmid stability protein